MTRRDALMTAARTHLAEKGWVRFAADPETSTWVRAVLPRARAALADPVHAPQWHCDGTWFVGVDVLDNDAKGTVGDVPLAGPGPAFVQALFGPLPLHRAQISAVRPGYPRPRAGESAAAFRYRQTRDAAHVDGLLPMGPARRRVLGEPHAWILGLPLTEGHEHAAPLVVWDGSHLPLGQALSDALRDHAPDAWQSVDLTDVYQATRREVFETCRRRLLPASPGEALLLHRHLLHGIAPWAGPPGADQRLIAYFRPHLTADPTLWRAP